MVMSRTSKLVTAEVDGRIEELEVAPGQRVTAGTTLAVLDPAEVDREVEAARGAEDAALGELRRAESQRSEAGRQARQLRGLWRDGAVSRDQATSAGSAYAIADAQVQTAEGAVRRARAAREQAEQLRAKTTIVAPIDGVVTLVKVSDGQMAARGQPVARIFDPADLWVRFAVPPDRRDQFAPGAVVAVTPRSGKAGPLTATVQVVRSLEPPLRFAVVDADLDDAALADRDVLLSVQVDVRAK